MSEKKKLFRAIANETNFDVQKVKDRAIKDKTETAENFNHLYDDYKINTDKVTKIIVGTFTPWLGRKRGFFYSSDKEGYTNPTFGYVDAYLNNGGHLQTLKEKLIKSPQNPDILKQIINYLVSNNIIFLDVIKCISDKEEKSAADSDIKYFCLDADSFKKYLNREIVFFPNSRDAEWSLKQIFKYWGRDVKDEHIHYISQISYRCTNEELCNRWKNELQLIKEDFH